MAEDVDIEGFEAAILVFHFMAEKSLSAGLDWCGLTLNEF